MNNIHTKSILQNPIYLLTDPFQYNSSLNIKHHPNQYVNSTLIGKLRSGNT